MKNKHRFVYYLISLGALFVLYLMMSPRVTATSETGLRSLLDSGGTEVLSPDSLFLSPVQGLDLTSSTSSVVVSRGQAFDKALRVVVGQDSDKSYVTQSTLRTTVAVATGDILLASFYVRGLAADNSTPATIEFLFEKASPPWTRSTQIGVFTRPDLEWKQVLVPFRAVDDFAAGEAMVSFRYAFGPQTVEIAGLKLRNLGSGPSLQALHEAIALAQPLGGIDVDIRFQTAHQILSGLGGNFAQARYGYSEWIDPVGHHNLTQLRMDNARIGLPLNHWAPSPGQYADKGK